MKTLLEIFGFTMDVVNTAHPTSRDELDADQHILIGIGMILFAIAFIIYARYF